MRDYDCEPQADVYLFLAPQYIGWIALCLLQIYTILYFSCPKCENRLEKKTRINFKASMHQQQIEDYDENRGKIGRAIQKFNIKSKLLFIGKYEESNSYAYVQELLKSEKEADFNKREKSLGLCMGCIKGMFLNEI